eukprot:TRINITY_DN3667_c0_g1_i1.p1 TRINITY_DN3667_c0_g1~~TRINITY_DN3667_c0_g1_i1.p1  ORF type:complete len:607 (-),score=213.16 TRINITY_DN3667_c0_g1_i1:413-2023(-)
MRAGSNGMNDLVVIQATQGLCAYLEKQFGEKVKEMGVAIGYDHRARGTLSSKNFGMLAASVFLSKGIKVYIYSDLVSTPLVPFLVDQKGCAAGIMVTASHNPPADDGYKVYWANGCQIIPPHDAGIAECILENLKPWENYDVAKVVSHELYEDPIEEMRELYPRVCKEKQCFHEEDNKESTVPICYTAMHGVGGEWTRRVFESFGHKPYVIVPEQHNPDPAFPTVSFPNPEEAGALDCAQRIADENSCPVILANDPDADRLAAAEKRPDGSWHVFHGNELGTLLADWTWKKHVEKTNGNPGKCAMVASTVSSKMIGAMGAKEGFKFVETLTGFKWMGNVSEDLRKEGYTVLLSYEEAIGYCVGDVVKDKDGCCASGVFAEMVKQLYKEGTTLYDHLQATYAKYGFFKSSNSYVLCYDSNITNKIFERLQNGGKYWDACGKYKIKAIRDLKAPGYDSTTPDNKPAFPVSGSQMLTYTFENGCVLTLRTSGTEPKIKWYCELGLATLEETNAVLADQVACIVNEMLQPELHGLERAKQ